MRIDAVGAGAFALVDDAFHRRDRAVTVGDGAQSGEISERGTDLAGTVTEEERPVVEFGDEVLDSSVEPTDGVEPEW